MISPRANYRAAAKLGLAPEALCGNSLSGTGHVRSHLGMCRIFSQVPTPSYRPARSKGGLDFWFLD